MTPSGCEPERVGLAVQGRCTTPFDLAVPESGMHHRIFLVVAILAALVSGCGGSSSPSAPTPTAPSGPPLPTAPFSRTDLREGTGAEAVNGRRLAMHYTGWLYDPTAPESKGRQFDTSTGGAPFPFVLGTGGVIRGWDLGVLGMKVGGQRRLVIPPDLAYGAGGRDPIPPNATLVFDLELVSVQ